jgi:hypothetical protein
MKQFPSLHIINGDASLQAFQSAKLLGQQMVWREILSEGSVLASSSEAEFWMNRKDFITSNFNESAEEYKRKVLDELAKLEQAGSFFEVILWFDTDLMCQINLLYLLHKLYKLEPNTVSICTPKAGTNIASLSESKIHKLFESRVQLNKDQLAQAAKFWQLYASPEPIELQSSLERENTLPASIHAALRLFFHRFPDCKTGLSQPETIILNLIRNGAKSNSELIHQFSEQYPAYGFGDLQVLEILNRLQPDLIQGRENLQLSFFGERVLEGIATATPKQRWLGGTKIDTSGHICFNSITQKIEAK